MAAVSDLVFGVAMAAVAVNAANAVLETEDKHMDLVGAVIVGLAASLGGGVLVLGLRLAALRFRLRMPEFRTPP